MDLDMLKTAPKTRKASTTYKESSMINSLLRHLEEDEVGRKSV
jgi:hypothetical protein